MMLPTHILRKLARRTQDSQRFPSLDGEVSNRLGFQRRVLNFYKTFLLVMYTANCVFLRRPKACSHGSTWVCSSSIIHQSFESCSFHSKYVGRCQQKKCFNLDFDRHAVCPRDLPLRHKSVHLCVEGFLRGWRHLLSPPPPCCAPAPAPWCGSSSSPASSNLGPEPSHTTSWSVCTAHLTIIFLIKTVQQLWLQREEGTNQVCLPQETPLVLRALKFCPRRVLERSMSDGEVPRS